MTASLHCFQRFCGTALLGTISSMYLFALQAYHGVQFWGTQSLSVEQRNGQGSWVLPKASSSSFLGLSSVPCSHLPPRAPHSLSLFQGFCFSCRRRIQGFYFLAPPPFICPKPKAYPRLVHWWLSSRPCQAVSFLAMFPATPHSGQF